MKKILGLDLGTTSVGWAIVNQAEKDSEHSGIIACGSRVVPLAADEEDNFEKGKAISTNAERRLKRSMRRNLQRRKQRRDNLVSLFAREGWIHEGESLSEQGKDSTHSTLKLRAKAASEEISLKDLARVFLNINNKRGYKSSRKTDSIEDGQLIDGMKVARDLHQSGLTPAAYALKNMSNGHLGHIDFYRSDLVAELEEIWNFQLQFYPELLTDNFKEQISNQGRAGTSRFFQNNYKIFSADNKGKDRRIVALQWRVDALSKRLSPEVLAYVISDLRGNIQNASGYLAAISDRSKELFFYNETVGQYLYRQLQTDSLFSTCNKVFYRQDYRDEFDRIWDTQAR
ncbi:MAG: type II CRISPR RNA-guided endonuclease Cas9, partial [Bacteroidales bacterium]|nr:type II CRISPR RNA-guided endonuclease Cas9 [Bacteroidales bacterium]